MRTLLVLALIGLPIRAAQWISVESAGVTLYTDGGPRQAQAIFTRLAGLRALFAEGLRSQPPRLQIFAFAAERDFRAVAPSATVSGFYRSSPGRELIVLQGGAAAERTLAHEYTHLLLQHSGPLAWPAWLEEGMAEFYSTVSWSGKGVVVGEPIAGHRAKLAKETWLSAEELDPARSMVDSPDAMVYAQGWALVHMMNVEPAYRDHTPQFFANVLAGKSTSQGWAEVFGKTLQQSLVELRQYVPRMKSVTLPSDTAVHIEPLVPTPLSTTDAAIVRAELALLTSHVDLARSLIAGLPSTSPKVVAAQGQIAAYENDSAQAIRYLEQSIALGGKDATVWFELALAKQAVGVPRAEVEDLLRKAVNADANFADARFLLGGRLADRREFAEGIALLREAVKLRPSRSSYWYGLSFALKSAGQTEEALEAAQNAVRTAQSSTDDAMASTLRDSLRKGF